MTHLTPERRDALADEIHDALIAALMPISKRQSDDGDACVDCFLKTEISQLLDWLAIDIALLVVTDGAVDSAKLQRVMANVTRGIHMAVADETHARTVKPTTARLH